MNNSIFKIFCLVILLWCVGCCSVVDPYNTVGKFKTPTSYSTPAILLPSLTTTATVFPSLTTIPLKSETPVPPKIDVELLETTCDEFCLWGIVPGETQVQELLTWAQNKPINLHQFREDLFSFGFETISGTTYIGSFQVENETIVGINFSIEPSGSVFNLQGREIYFSMDSVLEKYGVPSSIVLDVENLHEYDINSSPPDKVLHNYILFFDDIDVTINYSGGLINNKENDVYVFCPGQDGLLSISLWAGTTENAPERNYFPSIEEASSISIEVFCKRLLADPENYCQNMRADVFTD